MSDSKQDRVKETDATDDGSFAPLDSVLGSLQTSLGSSFENLSKGLHGNMELVKSLGVALDNIIQTRINITSHLKPIENAVQLAITVENATPFSLANVTGQILFDTKQEISIELSDSYFLVTDKEDGAEIEEVVPSIFENPTDLEANSRYVQMSHIKTLEPIYTIGTIQLFLFHPTRGDEIIIEKRFGLYVIDQLVKSTVSLKEDENDDEIKTTTTTTTNSIKRTYPVEFIRDIMEIHPIKGLDKGMRIALSGKKFEALCKIIDFSEDYTTCQVEFLLKSGNSSILEQVVCELDSLSKMS